MSANKFNTAFSDGENSTPLCIAQPDKWSRHATTEDAPNESNTQRSQNQESNTQQTENTTQQSGSNASESNTQQSGSNASESNTQQPEPNVSESNTQQSEPNASEGNTQQQGQDGSSECAASSERTTWQTRQNGPSECTADSERTNQQHAWENPDVPLSSIEDDQGQRILRDKCRKAVERVLTHQHEDFWAMLGLNPSWVTRSHARNQYRKLSLLLHPDKHSEADRPRAQQAQSCKYEESSLRNTTVDNL